MREIKFRGRTVNGNEWLHSNSIEVISGLTYLKDDLSHWKRVHSDTVGQFTGFDDKNNREIYEGDIFKSINYSGRVVFQGACFKLITDRRKRPRFWSLNESSRKSIEIIGNIHEQSKN